MGTFRVRVTRRNGETVDVRLAMQTRKMAEAEVSARATPDWESSQLEEWQENANRWAPLGMARAHDRKASP